MSERGLPVMEGEQNKAVRGAEGFLSCLRNRHMMQRENISPEWQYRGISRVGIFILKGFPFIFAIFQISSQSEIFP